VARDEELGAFELWTGHGAPELEKDRSDSFRGLRGIESKIDEVDGARSRHRSAIG
jgi:hypothetical protein